MAKVASGNGESFVVSLHFVHEPDAEAPMEQRLAAPQRGS
jgi:hypothetical protein